MLKAVAARAYKAGVACFLGVAFVLTPTAGQARNHPSTDGQATITVAQLPPQGRETYALIRQGGPFPYDKDGTVFGNRERLLPAHKRGYYREYTVRTPGARNRGARRIVCGGKPRTPDACYYTSDHYASFREIVE
ncbi:ribonuclease domain-containing protein [Simplicispira lacusdiani]|uniref:ribonuclease domain-containing protein n=1 Tax=Simplicispira lacusdiani TaxID=2213010 RepID=UPI000E75106B|nr:ribonuclease [Simplicispira lacusdiani]